jgi:hypothetical protein
MGYYQRIHEKLLNLPDVATPFAATAVLEQGYATPAQTARK